MAIQVFVADEQSDQPVNLRRARALAEAVLADRGIGGPAELDVLFVDEAAIAALNERYLGATGATDVLSFPIDGQLALGGPPGGPLQPMSGPGRSLVEEEVDGAPLMLGDVIICPAVAERNASTHAGSYDDEVDLLLVHGILHLLGMDHEDESEAEEMEALERELLTRHKEPADRQW
jgi:probable rRNA maturation factor